MGRYSFNSFALALSIAGKSLRTARGAASSFDRKSYQTMEDVSRD
jgi:hypothetical protein